MPWVFSSRVDFMLLSFKRLLIVVKVTTINLFCTYFEPLPHIIINYINVKVYTT